MRQKYHFATDNGILIWDVTSILEDIEQHPDSYTIQTLSTALLAFQRSFAADRRQSPSA